MNMSYNEGLFPDSKTESHNECNRCILKLELRNSKIWTSKKKPIEGIYDILSFFLSSHIFYRQLHFSSQPGVANGFWENEAENCLVVA